MKVSIITPYYNKKQFFFETAISVFEQTYTNWEWIIVNDASNDASTELLTEIQNKDERVFIQFNKKNNGANYCRNQGLKNANGEYIIFFDADDLMEPFCLEQRVSEIKNNPNHDMWVFPMGIFNNQKNDLDISKNWIPPSNKKDFFKLFLKHQLPWQTMQPIWRKSFLLEIKGFDESFSRFQDVELHTRALLKNSRVITFPNLKADVFFRIEENRKTYTNSQFYHKFVNSSIQYYDKFYKLVNEIKYKKNLSNTLFEILTIISYQKRMNNISKEVFNTFKTNLISSCNLKRDQFYMKYFVFIYFIFPFHPKGLKKLFLKTFFK